MRLSRSFDFWFNAAAIVALVVAVSLAIEAYRYRKAHPRTDPPCYMPSDIGSDKPPSTWRSCQ